MRSRPTPAPPAPSFPWLLVAVVVVLVVGGVVSWWVRGIAQEQPTPTATAVPVVVASATPRSGATPAPTATTVAAAPVATATPPRRYLAMDEIVYAPDFYRDAITAYLQQAGGELASVTLNVGGRRYDFATTLLGQTLYYSVSPKVILALIEYQSDLVSQANLPSERYTWAAGYRGDGGRFAGLGAQMRWAVRELYYARRDLPVRPALTYLDGEVAAPAYLSDTQYLIARLLAPTIYSDRLDVALWQYADTYERLFGALPATLPTVPPAPVMLHRPLAEILPVTSFFDHGGPFLTRNAADGVTTYWGHTETDMAFAYDGHDGWDYAGAPPDPALASAAGTVVFAGIADDNCDTRAVIVEHGRDVRTLYWHLSQILVEVGQVVAQGETIGIIGETGCAKGPHLHFGVQYRGVSVDPYGWCAPTPDPWQAHPAGAGSTWMWADQPSPCAPPPAGSVLVDSDDPQQFQVRNATMTDVPAGVGNRALFTSSQRGYDRMRPWRARPFVPMAIAEWSAPLPTPGTYRVMAYVPYALSGLIDSDGVMYQILHRDGVAEVRVNSQEVANEWVDLGTYTFAARGRVLLPLRDAIGGRGIWADAIIWMPVAGSSP